MEKQESAIQYPNDDYVSEVNLNLAKDVNEHDVRLVYYTSSGEEVQPSELNNLPTKVLIHGWFTSLENNTYYAPIKEAYIKEKQEINVIYVDYSKFSKELYSIAAATVPNVGKVLAKQLLKTKIDTCNIHLIGHSLGSQVAGNIGREIYNITGEKIARITLLDPTGVKFDKTSSIRVNKNDAKFVDAIHTDDGHYGTSLLLGHVDMFPNGGKEQPGCPSLLIDDNCSHARSTIYFAESISKRPRIARKAASWEDYLNGKFMDDTPEIFGEYISTQAEGQFYFVTNSAKPFFESSHLN